MEWNIKRNYLVTPVIVFLKLRTRIWMRSNACCLDLIHFAKPHRNRLWSFEPFSCGVQVKSPENEKLWIYNSLAFHCKARSRAIAWVLWSNQKSKSTRHTFVSQALHSLSFSKSLFSGSLFSLLLFLFFSFRLGFCQAAFVLVKFSPNPLVVRWRHHVRDMMTSRWCHDVTRTMSLIIVIRKNFWYGFFFFFAAFFQLESLFSNPYYVKPQRPSVSSLYGPGGGDRKNSYEVTKSFSSQ